MAGTIHCEICGQEVEKRGTHQKYCPTCRKKMLKARSKAQNETKRQQKREAAPKPRERNFDACMPCEYSKEYNGWWGCDYSGMTGQLRPCPSMYAAGTCECFTPRCTVHRGSGIFFGPRRKDGGDYE